MIGSSCLPPFSMRLRLTVLSVLLAFPAATFAADSDKALLGVDTKTDHILGDANASSSMIIYTDFQCPFCQRFHPTVQEIRKAYPKLRIVYRNFPLPSIHSFAVPAAKTAECVATHKGNTAYWSFVDALFDREGELSAALLKTLAVDQGITDAQFTACQDDTAIIEKIGNDMKSAQLAGISGTPTSFLINAEGTAFPVVGAVPFDTISAKLQRFTFEKSVPSTKVKTTKRQARVRAIVPGVRRWK